MLRANVVVVIIVLLIVVLIAVHAFFFLCDKSEREVLSDKLYIPINESYEIEYFKNIKGFGNNRCCQAILLIDELDYDLFETDIKNAGYEGFSFDDELYDIYFQNNPWINSSNLEKAFEYSTTEIHHLFLGRRVSIEIFVSKSENGYRYIFINRGN